MFNEASFIGFFFFFFFFLIWHGMMFWRKAERTNRANIAKVQTGHDQPKRCKSLAASTLPHRVKRHPPTSQMDPPMQPRMGPNMPIVQPRFPQLNPFQPESFDPYRPIDNIAPQPLQPFPPQQGAIALENNAHVTPNNGLDLLQPADQSQQSSSGGVAASVPFAGSWEGVEFIPNPPSLEHWRNELFHLETPITFSEEQYANCPSQYLPF